MGTSTKRVLEVTVISPDSGRARMVSNYFNHLSNTEVNLTIIAAVDRAAQPITQSVSELIVDTTDGISDQQIASLVQRFDAKRTTFFKGEDDTPILAHMRCLLGFGY